MRWRTELNSNTDVSYRWSLDSSSADRNGGAVWGSMWRDATHRVRHPVARTPRRRLRRSSNAIATLLLVRTRGRQIRQPCVAEITTRMCPEPSPPA
jgi:nitrous oxidase accessory protein NosD